MVCFNFLGICMCLSLLLVDASRQRRLLQTHVLRNWEPPLHGGHAEPGLCKQMRLLLEVKYWCSFTVGWALCSTRSLTCSSNLGQYYLCAPFTWKLGEEGFGREQRCSPFLPVLFPFWELWNLWVRDGRRWAGWVGSTAQRLKGILGLPSTTSPRTVSCAAMSWAPASSD